jgi:hypothetical protein
MYRLMAVDKNLRREALGAMHVAAPTRSFNVDGMMDYPLRNVAIGGVLQELDDSTKKLVVTLIVQSLKDMKAPTYHIAQLVYRFLKSKGYNRLADEVIRMLSASQRNPETTIRRYFELALDVFTRPPRRRHVSVPRPDLPPVVMTRRGRTTSRSRRVSRLNPQLSQRNRGIYSVMRKTDKKIYQFLRSLPVSVALLALNCIISDGGMAGVWNNFWVYPHDERTLQLLPLDLRQKLRKVLPGEAPDVLAHINFSEKLYDIADRIDDDYYMDEEGHLHGYW